jgi:hypothetical protein
MDMKTNLSLFHLLIGTSVYNEPGDLVCTKAFPCMPVYFLHDVENLKYRAAYFMIHCGL